MRGLSFLLLVGALSSVLPASAQKKGLVDKSGRVVSVFPDSVEVANLADPDYGRLRVKEDMPNEDWGKKRLDKDDNVVDRLFLVAPDTLVVGKKTVNMKVSIEGGKGALDPDSLFGKWAIEPQDSLSREAGIGERGKIRVTNYNNFHIKVSHPRDDSAEGWGSMTISGPWKPARVVVDYDPLK